MERDEACVVCSERDMSNGGARWRRQMLICDRCLDGAHRGCLSARHVMPLDGAWMCPRCRMRGDAVEIGVRSRRRLTRLVSETGAASVDRGMLFSLVRFADKWSCEPQLCVLARR
jgi:hypothetical protein